MKPDKEGKAIITWAIILFSLSILLQIIWR